MSAGRNPHTVALARDPLWHGHSSTARMSAPSAVTHTTALDPAHRLLEWRVVFTFEERSMNKPTWTRCILALALAVAALGAGCGDKSGSSSTSPGTPASAASAP